VIDWKRRAVELAIVVNRHEKERMLNDRNLGWELAKQMLKDAKIEERAKVKFWEWWRCSDKKKRKRLYDEYLKLVRSVNQGGDECR
jgi:hypothetical protein